MDVPDRLQAQAPLPSVTPPVGQQPGVEGVEVFGRQLVERDTSELGEDVEVDVSPVGVEGAPPELRLLEGGSRDLPNLMMPSPARGSARAGPRGAKGRP